LFLLVAPLNSPAQDRIDTNRPSFSSSPYVLSRGNWQIETGIDYEKSSTESDTTSLTLPSALLRFGLADVVELHVEWGGVTRSRSDGNTTTGITDASIGVKIQVTGDQARTMAAILAELTVPVGDTAFTSDRWDPTIGIAWAHAGSLNWAGTAKITMNDSDYQFDNGVVLSFASSANSSTFVEWEANVPEGGSTIHKLNGGFLWWQGPVIQFDVNGSLGLNDEAADYKLGLGWSYRF
jgi:hypothetical protein